MNREIAAKPTNACGMGYPPSFPCVRKKGHSSPVSTCFSVYKSQGVYLYQDGKERVPRNQWPDDIVHWPGLTDWIDVI